MGLSSFDEAGFPGWLGLVRIVFIFFPLMVRTAQDAPVFYGKFASQSTHYETDDMACEFWHSCMVGGSLLIFGLSASVFLTM